MAKAKKGRSEAGPAVTTGPLPEPPKQTEERPIGVLYLVATPIGNLEDITARALRVLREVDAIAAEDTRVTRKLLAHFDIHTPLTSYHAHSSEQKSDYLLERLRAGERIALVADAGTPAVSDPGADLVAAAVAAGVRVEPIPGASAALAALVASGLPTGRFVFEGFLPRTKPDRRERLLTISREPRTVIVYEAPPRVTELLTDLIDACGPDRQVALARELTKRFEEFVRGSLAEALAHFTATPPRGEFALVLAGAPEGSVSTSSDDTIDIDTLIREALSRGDRPRDVAHRVAEITGESRNLVYARVLSLRES